MLGQGLEKTSELDIEEKCRLLPHHMHINKDLVDFCFMVSSMLLEVVNISKNEHSRTVISRSFRMLIENSEKSLFCFPPDNYRDQISAAFRTIHQGNWKEALHHLLASTKVWDSMLYKD